MAAVKDKWPQLTAGYSFARIKSALSGFGKSRPPRSRAPVPKEIVGGLIKVLTLHGAHDLALMVMVMFATYARPGEVRSLTARQVLRPARKMGRLARWAIAIAPQEECAQLPQALPKTGTMDDTILIGRPAFLGPMIGQVCGAVQTGRRGAGSCRVGAVSASARKSIRGLLEPGAAPWELRARGRWSSDSSLRRYATPAIAEQLLKEMSPEGLAFCRGAWARVEGLLLRRTAPRPPPQCNAVTRRAVTTL